MLRRIISFLMALVMIVGMVPTAAFAQETEPVSVTAEDEGGEASSAATEPLETESAPTESSEPEPPASSESVPVSEETSEPAETTESADTTPVETTEPVDTTPVETTEPEDTTPVETTEPEDTTPVETTEPVDTTPVETTEPVDTTPMETTEAAEETVGGACGENLFWSFDEETGTLTISGEGAMEDYARNCTPWAHLQEKIARVILDSGVIATGDNAFFGCTNLTIAEIPDTVMEIAYASFTDCSSLAEAAIPEQLTALGEYAFAGTALTAVVLPEGLAAVENSAFYDCTALTSVTIPGTVTRIAERAFHNCTSLSQVELPQGVTSIGDGAFANCGKLTQLDIPDSVMQIAYAAFADCTSLTSAELPANLETISESLLQGCDALQTVTIPEGVASIGVNAFSGCNSLTGVTLPQSLRALMANAFASCYGLTKVTIPENVSMIGMGAFGDCQNLTEITFRCAVPNMSSRFFLGMPGLKTIWVPSAYYAAYTAAFGSCLREGMSIQAFDAVEEEPEGISWSFDEETGTLTISGKGAMEDYSWTGTNMSPWYDQREQIVKAIIDEGVTAIGKYAFFDCPNLTDVSIAESVVSIGTSAFERCEKLEEVQLPEGLEVLENDVFMNCPSLKKLTIPGSVKNLTSIFSGCESLEEVILSEGVETLEGWVFGGTALKRIDIPASVTEIAMDTFMDCYSLTGIWVDAKNPNYSNDEVGVLYNKNQTQLIQYPAGRAGEYEIPAGITTIPYSAFRYSQKLTKLTIPGSVVSIEDSAFEECTGLQSITFLGDAPEFGGEWIFSNVTAIAYYPADNATWTEDKMQSYNGNLIWTEAGTEPSLGGGSGENLTWKIDGDGVLTITGSGDMDSYDWQSYRSLITKVVIGEGITSICNDAFRDCVNLVSAEIPSSVSNIGDAAFYHCAALKEIVLPEDIPSVNYDTFSECTSLSRVTIPEGVTEIGSHAFHNCASLQQIQLPASLQSISDNAFGKCAALTEIVLPGHVSGIDMEAFAHCTGLKRIRFAGNAPYISEDAFIGVAAEVSYNGSHVSWTEDRLQNYGGSLNWVSYGNSDLLTGECGEQATWEFNRVTGTMTISGEGEMQVAEESVSWSEYVDVSADIKSVVVEEGITMVSGFANCAALTEVSLPDSVVTLGDSSFYSCSSLQHIDLPKNLKAINYDSFSECVSLTEIVIPETVTEIGEWAFNNCGLTDVTIPKNVASIGNNAFAGNSKMRTVTFTGNAPEIGSEAFCETVAIVNYPQNDETWTEDVRQNYGGSLIWAKTGSNILLSGTCGDALVWELDRDGVLTVSGTGEMTGSDWNAYGSLITKLAIGQGVTSLVSDSFWGCANLESVSIPDTVTWIGTSVFRDCVKLNSVTIPAGVTYIGDSTFSGCTGLVSVTLPEKLTSIDFDTFYGCTSLTEIVIPKHVSYLGDNVFTDCTALKTIRFEGNAPGISESAFTNVTAKVWYPVASVTWSEDVRRSYGGTPDWWGYGPMNPITGPCGEGKSWSFDKDTGVLTISGTGEMDDDCTYWADYMEPAWDLKRLVIEAGITRVGNSCFSGCAALESVSLPSSLEVLGNDAFRGCSSLTKVTIPENVTYLGDGFFADCTSLKEIHFTGDSPDFAEMSMLENIAVKAFFPAGNDTWTDDRMWDFDGRATWIKSDYTYAKGIAGDIGWRYEEVQGKLTLFNWGDMADYTSAEEVPWADFAAKITTLEISEDVRSIGSYAFYGFTGLTAVTVPEGITALGNEAFSGCTGLKTIRFLGDAPALAEDCTGVFNGVTAEAYYPSDRSEWNKTWMDTCGGDITWLTSGSCGMEVSEDVLWALNATTGVLTISGKGEMGDGAPWSGYQDAITSVVIEHGVTNIGSDTFWGCINLESVSIPNTVTGIGTSAFRDCAKLKTVAIPEGVTYIGDSAFSGCAGMTSVNLPEMITGIDFDTFKGCTSLTQITIPKYVSGIGSNAFADCTSLDMIRFECCPDYIEETAFENVEAKAYYPASGVVWTDADNGLRQNYNGTLTWLSYGDFAPITGYQGNTSLWAFDETTGIMTISGQGPMGDGMNWLNYVDSGVITGVVIEEGITRIGDDSFEYCGNLESVSIPDTVTEIGTGAFRECISLTEFTFSDEITAIGGEAFSGCTGIERLFFIGDVPAIEDSAFSGVTADAIYPAQNDTWTDNALQGYGGDINWMPEGMTDRGECGDSAVWTMYDDGLLTLSGGWIDGYGATSGYPWYEYKEDIVKVIFKDDVTNIPANAFSDYDALEEVEIGSSVSWIGEQAFADCGALTCIRIPENVTQIYSHAFAYCPELVKIIFEHEASDSLSLASTVFYESGHVAYAKPETFVQVPTRRNIHSAIRNYNWGYNGPPVTFQSTPGYKPAEKVAISSDIIYSADVLGQIEAGLEANFWLVNPEPLDTSSEMVWSLSYDVDYFGEPGEAIMGQTQSPDRVVVIGTKPGMVRITMASSDNPSVRATAVIEILPPTGKAESIAVRCEGEVEDEVEVGASVQMIADVYPGNTANKAVTWAVEDGAGTAEISEDGVLTGLTAGTVTVYATSTDGTEIVGSRVVNVMRYVEDITPLLNGKDGVRRIGVGETMTLDAILTPADATVQTVTWTVETNDGTVELDGNRWPDKNEADAWITGITPGTVTLIATSDDNQALRVSMELEVVGDRASYAVTGGNIYYNTETGAIVDCDNTVTSANIPAKMPDGTVITSIAPYAFVNIDETGFQDINTTLTSVTIPSTVTQIGQRAFSWCEALNSLKISGNGLTDIGAYAFYNCECLNSLTLPVSVEQVGSGAFYGLDSLKHLTISGELQTEDWLDYNDYNNILETATFTGTSIAPANVVDHGNWTSVTDFPGRNAKKVILSDSIVSIGEYAFYGCENIEQIVIGSGVKEIEKHAFDMCRNLIGVTLPEGLTTIGECAFRECEALTSINLPSTLTSIGQYAFSGCEKAQIIDLSEVPDVILRKTTELDDLVKVPTVLVSATGGEVELYWHMSGEEDYKIANIYSYGPNRDFRLEAIGTGEITLVCRDEYTGAVGTKQVSVETGIEIRKDKNVGYLVSGKTLGLSAYRMPDDVKENVIWESSNETYATVNAKGVVTAQNVGKAVQVTISAMPENGGEGAEITFWVLPQGSGLNISGGKDDIVLDDTTMDVDMADDDQISLSAHMDGLVDADGITWSTSAKAVATVDENGTVTLLKPGKVTITAKEVYGSSASVTLNVIYLDAAAKLTAEAEVPAIGLQPGEETLMLVSGEQSLAAEKLSFVSSNSDIASVDENGVITGGTKPGTATITAAITGDPLNRKVSVKVKVIAAQTESLILRPDMLEKAEYVMWDADGNETAISEQAVKYAVYLNKDTTSDRTFTIAPEALDRLGEALEVSKTSLKWTTGDKKVAEITVNGDGSVSVKVKKNADGACVISAVTTDLAKKSAELLLYVRDYAPRLGAASVTLNPNLEAGVEVPLVESYGNTVEKVSYADERLAVSYEEGILTIKAKDTIKNTTITGVLTVTCADGNEYPYTLKVAVKNASPAITVKQTEKFAIFYTESTANLNVTAKNAEVSGVEVKGAENEDFTVEFDEDTKLATLRYADSYIDDHSVKADTKLTLLVSVEGYVKPEEKTISVSTNKTKPSLVLSSTSSIINTTVSTAHSTTFEVLEKNGPALDLSDADVTFAADFAESNVNGDITLTLTGTTGGTAAIWVQLENWTEAIKLSHKITVDKKAPAAKLEKKSMELNSLFWEKGDENTVSLNQSNLTISYLDNFTSTAKDPTQANKIELSWVGDKIVAKIKDGDDLPKAGTYTYTAVPHLTAGEPLAPVTIKVVVKETAPKVSFTNGTLKLNRILCDGGETASTGYKISGYTVVDFKKLADWEHEDVNLFLNENGELTAQLNSAEAAKKTHSFSLTPIVRDAEGNEAELPKPVTLKVQVYENEKITVSASSKGKLDLAIPGSSITYTINKISNANGTIQNCWLEGQDADLFEFEPATESAKPTFRLTLKEGEEYSTKTTYKVQQVFLINNREVRSAVLSIRVSQSSLKLTAPKTLNFYQSQTAPLTAQISLTSPTGASLADASITVNEAKTSKELLATLEAQEPEITDLAAEVSFKLENAVQLVSGKSYTLVLDVLPAGSATNAKPTQVKITVKILK